MTFRVVLRPERSDKGYYLQRRWLGFLWVNGVDGYIRKFNSEQEAIDFAVDVEPKKQREKKIIMESFEVSHNGFNI